MLENFIMQVRRPKGVSGKCEAFVSRAAQRLIIIKIIIGKETYSRLLLLLTS